MDWQHFNGLPGRCLRTGQNGINIVFIHGFTSDAKCWLNKNGTFWPSLLSREDTFAGCGIFVFNYLTNFNSSAYGVNDIADSLREFCNQHQLFASKATVFVCHSMGGIVARRFLVSEQSKLGYNNSVKNIGLFLIASPSLGSDYANKGKPLAGLMQNEQAQYLQFSDRNTLLNQLDRDFLKLKEAGNIEILGKELIEDKPLKNVPFIARPLLRRPIVLPFSAARYFSDSYKIPGSDHDTIAKPENERSVQHLALKHFLETCQAAWLSSAEPDGMAAQIMQSSLGEQATADERGDEKRDLRQNAIQQRYLALVLKEGEELEEDSNWIDRECPWEVRSYTWESWLYDAPSGRYNRQALDADIGSFLVDSNPREGSKRSSFDDLLRAAVAWIYRQPEKPENTTLELFVPIELLGFDWAGVSIHLKMGEAPLCQRIPFVLRSAERFYDEDKTALRSRLPEKYQQLTSGMGRWISDLQAAPPDPHLEPVDPLERLRTSGSKTDLVAVKHLQPVASTPRMRLTWHHHLVEAMVPLAIWWRSQEPDYDQARQNHLDKAYEGLLSGKNGDRVAWEGCHLARLPGLRQQSTGPHARDLVLLLDHPNRYPPAEPNRDPSTRSIPTRSA
jgi:pimeloyl-ACP methyl ester carboxylesterase